MPTPAIDIQNARKTYRGKVEALRGVDLRVNTGEIFGLLGPNGAGKSTLVKILMTAVRPTAIEGTVLGRPVAHKPTLAQVGYLPEQHRFPTHLTAMQVLLHFASLAGIARKESRPRAQTLLKRVGIADWANKRVGSFSKGMRQRLGIANALVNDPQLVVLDEPTDGVDPVGRRDIRNLLLQLKDEGRAVFINSHLLSELELCCDRVAIMLKGELRAAGTIDELTRDQRRYDIRVSHGAESLVDVAANTSVSEPDRQVSVPTTDANEIQPIIDRARASGIVVERITPHRPSLEELFIDLVEDHTPGAKVNSP
ncbi:MAG: ABC transporter ATP-binding protein [Planctomycetota bacterium]